jgi:hypothetical protein
MHPNVNAPSRDIKRNLNESDLSTHHPYNNLLRNWHIRIIAKKGDHLAFSIFEECWYISMADENEWYDSFSRQWPMNDVTKMKSNSYASSSSATMDLLAVLRRRMLVEPPKLGCGQEHAPPIMYHLETGMSGAEQWQPRVQHDMAATILAWIRAVLHEVIIVQQFSRSLSANSIWDSFKVPARPPCASYSCSTEQSAKSHHKCWSLDGRQDDLF